MADCVVKIFVEGGFESSIYGLGTEVCLCFSSPTNLSQLALNNL